MKPLNPLVGRLAIAAVAGTGLVVLGFVAFAPPGCGQSGPSDYDKMQQAKEGASTALTASGAKVKAMHYAIGDAYAVNLSGVTITDDLLRQVKQLGNISELNLSKSTVTDDHLGLIQELGLHVLLAKLDLSNTAVTDAGFNKLDGFVFLSELNLAGTKVTPAAADRLRKKQQSSPTARIKTVTVKLK